MKIGGKKDLKLGKVNLYIIERRTAVCKSSDSGILQHHEHQNWYLERHAVTGRATG